MTELYPYQLDGVLFLASRDRAYLGDEPGLGKTVQACAACQYLDAKKVLVIAPASTLPNWRYEFESWGPRGAQLVAVSYNKVAANRDSYKGRNFDAVILDEAHFCKNHKAKRAQAALKIAADAPRAWLLSATPMPNHPGELWYPLKKLWPDLVPESYQKFFDKYTVWTPTEWGPKPLSVKDKKGLRELVGKVMLRRSLDLVGVELPPLRVDVQLIPRSNVEELLGEDRSALEAYLAEMRADDGSLSRARRLLGSVKAPIIGEILADELERWEYPKIAVFAYHRDALDVLTEKLRPFGIVRIDGSSNDRERDEAIRLFQSDPNVRVFIGQQTASGTGTNLQVANELVLVEPSWNPAENYQTIKRVHRIGSVRPVRARIFAFDRTLDEAVMRTVARKTRMTDEILRPD